MSVEDPSRSQRVPSLVELMKEFDKGVMKVHRVFEGQIHESCPPSPETVDVKRERIDRFWKDEYLKTLNTTISHVQDWFTKISFRNKTAFMRKLIQEMADSKKLFDVAHFIGPPTKGMVYARAQFTRSPYDVAAIDHNRSVEDSLYDAKFTDYLEWFRSLNHQEQFNAMIGLAHLGGGALQECIYSDVAKVLSEKETNIIRQKVLEYLANKKKESYTVLASKVANRKKYGLSSDKRPSTAKPIVEDEERDVSGDLFASLKEKIEAFKTALRAMNDIAGGTYREPVKVEEKKKSKVGRKTTVAIAKKEKKARKGALHKLNAGLDRMQMLPLWDNRKITAFLPEKTRNTIVSVNKYWKNMVEKTKKELKVRQKIDKQLRGSDSRKPARKGNDGTKLDRRKSKKDLVKPTQSATSIVGRKVTKRSVELEDPFEPEDFQDRLNINTVFKGEPPKFDPYSKAYNEIVVCDKYCDDRVFDATKRWAAYSCKMDVEFANIVVGADCHLRLEGTHKTKISCLRFHPEGASIFTGGYDGLVKLHDIWKKVVKIVYHGHQGAVQDIAANCKYVASCGMDNQVRVFNIADGRYMFCYQLERHTPCRLLMTQCDEPILYVGNTSGELIMFNIRSEQQDKQVGRIVYAHRGEVTSLHHYPCLLLSSGIDGFVRMWTSNFVKPYWVVSLQHPFRVNSAILSYMKILSACEDGKIRIWDVMTSICERIIPVVKNCRPVLDIICINTPSIVKIVTSNEADIKVLEFPLRKIPKKKVGRPTRSMLKPVSDLKKKMTWNGPHLSPSDKRMMKFQMRQAVLPPIQPPTNVKSPPHPLLVKSAEDRTDTNIVAWSSKTITKII